MSKKRAKFDKFPAEILVQHSVETSDGQRNTWLNAVSDAEEAIDYDLCEGLPGGERVGVYKLVGVVKLTKKVSITRRKAR